MKKFHKNNIHIMDFDPNKYNLQKTFDEIGIKQQKSKGAQIVFNNIGKKYEGNDKYTLKDINLTIKPKSFCIFLGPSGCGKTTLLRMVAGLNSITRGDLLFDGKRFNNLSPSERNIAMVFQSYALYPHMNVYNNMSFGLKIAKERKDIINRRVKDAAKILKISDYLYNKPKDLSGGQRQRVAIGRAIVRKPSVFLMDEPLSNLDAKLRESMRRELVSIHRMLNTTSIYVTHDQLEAMTMGDQIVVINNGAIQQSGTSKELYFKPKNLFVAEFIGSPTMNFLKGKYIKGMFVANKIQYKQKINLKLKEGQEIIIGYRTEDTQVVNLKSQNLITGEIYNIEVLGKEQSIIIKINDQKYIISTMPNDVAYKIYDKKFIKFNLKRVHVFDAKTSMRIEA